VNIFLALLEDLKRADELASQVDHIFLVDFHLLLLSLFIAVRLLLDGVSELSREGLAVVLRSTHEVALESTASSHTLLEGLFHSVVDLVIPVLLISIDKNEVSEVTSHLADLVHEVSVVVATESNRHPSASHGLASLLLSRHLSLELVESGLTQSILQVGTAHESTIGEENCRKGGDSRESVT